MSDNPSPKTSDTLFCPTCNILLKIEIEGEPIYVCPTPTCEYEVGPATNNLVVFREKIGTTDELLTKYVSLDKMATDRVLPRRRIERCKNTNCDSTVVVYIIKDDTRENINICVSCGTQWIHQG
jgi:DNA-directed RNA polymerase subunit M/transcription elongation factor TFIIS